MSPALHPGFSGPWRPPPVLSYILSTFDCLFFLIYRERYDCEWAFFIRRRFLPYSPSWHFCHNLLSSKPPWELAVLPWSLQGFILIFKTQTRSICLFVNQTNRWAGLCFEDPQSSYILNLYLYMSISQKFLLAVKTLIKNKDQQPHYSAAMKMESSSQTNQQPQILNKLFPQKTHFRT